jgi:hypothetical protein
LEVGIRVQQTKRGYVAVVAVAVDDADGAGEVDDDAELVYLRGWKPGDPMDLKDDEDDAPAQVGENFE